MSGVYIAGTGTGWHSGSNCIYIGRYTDASAQDVQNEIVFGYNANGGGSNTITLGGSSITKLRCQVTAITALSDRRIKDEIELADLDMCLTDVLRLPLHRYKYKAFTGTHLDTHVTGFLADDVEQVFPKAVQASNQSFLVLDANGNQIMETFTDQGVSHERPKTFQMKDVKDITMTEALPTLWGAVQKLAAVVEAQAQRIAQLEANA
jgi:hypothetical protein